MSSGTAVGRIVTAALFTASLLMTMAATPSYALDPPRPLPGYRPTFVTERQPGPWVDCAWAAAAMLLDKWTSGTTTVDREHLRALSGDRVGGSSFADIRRAYAKLGLDLRWSPSGGERISWSALIGRLRHGSGAILMGDYAKMPRHYGRWDPSLLDNTGPLDDHALYLDGYDARTGRILVMDPLAPAGWHGEWIPASVLRKFAWHTGTAIWTATTPTAAAAPFAGVKLGPPSASGIAGAVQLSWPVEATPKGWSEPGFTASMTAEPITAPDPTAIDVAGFPATTPAAAARTAVVAIGDARSLEATIPLPATPGLYRMTATLTDQRFGGQVATAGPFNLYVPGPRAWNLVVPDDRSVVAGGLTALSIVVANVGTESWADATAGAGSIPYAASPTPRNTRLVGTWLPPAGMDDGRGGSAAPSDIDFGPLPLDAGYVQFVDRVIQVPLGVGAWRLELRVVDDRDGAGAFVGSAPGVILIDVGAADTSIPPR
jgi:hypothetical protein